MIKKILAAAVLVFGLGINGLAAQEVIKGPTDYETLVVQHGAICSSAESMKGFLDDGSFTPIFQGENDIASLSKDQRKPTTSRAQMLYSDKYKSAITVIYDWKVNTACIISGIKDVKVREDGINASLGLKVND